MAKLKITDEKGFNFVEGNVSFNISKNIDEEGIESLSCDGILYTHKYLEGITKIETSRYLLKDIEVYKESYGSNDFNILYSFTSEDWEIKGGQSNLSGNVIKEVEEKLYKNEDCKEWEDEEWR